MLKFMIFRAFETLSKYENKKKSIKNPIYHEMEKSRKKRSIILFSKIHENYSNTLPLSPAIEYQFVWFSSFFFYVRFVYYWSRFISVRINKEINKQTNNQTNFRTNKMLCKFIFFLNIIHSFVLIFHIYIYII